MFRIFSVFLFASVLLAEPADWIWSARYVITQRGKPAALLIPLDSALPEKSADEVWDRLMKIGEEISKGWESDKSAVEILSEMRR